MFAGRGPLEARSLKATPRLIMRYPGKMGRRLPIWIVRGLVVAHAVPRTGLGNSRIWARRIHYIIIEPRTGSLSGRTGEIER